LVKKYRIPPGEYLLKVELTGVDMDQPPPFEFLLVNPGAEKSIQIEKWRY